MEGDRAGFAGSTPSRSLDATAQVWPPSAAPLRTRQQEHFGGSQTSPNSQLSRRRAASDHPSASSSDAPGSVDPQNIRADKQWQPRGGQRANGTGYAGARASAASQRPNPQQPLQEAPTWQQQDHQHRHLPRGRQPRSIALSSTSAVVPQSNDSSTASPDPIAAGNATASNGHAGAGRVARVRQAASPVEKLTWQQQELQQEQQPSQPQPQRQRASCQNLSDADLDTSCRGPPQRQDRQPRQRPQHQYQQQQQPPPPHPHSHRGSQQWQRTASAPDLQGSDVMSPSTGAGPSAAGQQDRKSSYTRSPSMRANQDPQGPPGLRRSRVTAACGGPDIADGSLQQSNNADRSPACQRDTSSVDAKDAAALDSRASLASDLPGLAGLNRHEARGAQVGTQRSKLPRTQKGVAPRAAQGAGSSLATAALAAVASSHAADPTNSRIGSDADGEDLFTCVVCCELTYAMAIGKCDHHQVCAKCCLRLRLCYHDRKCPLCKSENDDVVVVRPTVGGVVPSYESLAAATDQLWAKPRWARGVLVYDPPAQVHGSASVPRHAPHVPLHVQLLRLTANACAVCDRGGRHPFPSDKALKEHLRSSHGRQICPICFEARRRFVLEFDTLTDDQLAAHKKAAHSLCKFCGTNFYGLDELYAHMTQHHYTCHVCQRAGIQHLYLRDAQELSAHLHADHFACEEPDCAECFLAFATEEELRQHAVQRHSTHMPRWNPARARPLMLDLTPTASAPRHSTGRGGGSGSGGAANGGRRAVRRGGGDEPASASDNRGPRASAGSPPRPVPLHRELGSERDVEGGLAIIDDDLGSYAGQADEGPVGTPQNERRLAGSAPRRLAGAWARRAGDSAPMDEYPSLAASAATAPTAAATATAGGAGTGWAQRPALPTLRRVTVTCPCGRRASAVALLDEEQPPTLACDRECELAGRRNQIAGAFGVDDPDTHVSSFERSRHANYAPALIQTAQQHLDWLRPVEAELVGFVTDKARKRHVLAPASADKRELTHQLAEHYGLTTTSVGQEPTRAVQLFKSPSSGVPQQSLVVVAATTTRSQLAALLAAVPNWSLRFVDLSPDANLAYHLREWAGEYAISYTGGERERGASAGRGATAATATFSSERAFRAASDAVAGGVRGEFRVDRSAGAGGSSSLTASVPRPGPSMALAGPAIAAPAGWQVVTKGKSTRRTGDGAASSNTTGAAGVGFASTIGMFTPPFAAGTIARARGAGNAHAADPWASDDEDGTDKRGKPKPVIDDWEAEVGVPSGNAQQRAALDLGDSNAWDVLGDELAFDDVAEPQVLPSLATGDNTAVGAVAMDA